MIHLDVDYKSMNKNGEELCGDMVEIIRGEDADIVVLSDGLGSGVKANILATLTTKIITTMLEEGSSVDEAVDTVVHTLPICKTRGIAYSTFSILRIDHEGHAYLAEFDSPATVLVRNGELLEIDYETREISGKSVREASFDVAPGDLFCLISDGVIHAGVGALLNFGWQWDNVANFVTECGQKKLSAPRCAAALSQVVSGLYMEKPGDDSTMLFVRVMPRRTVALLSGPPVDKADDEGMVRDFMKCGQKKVVCGGSSANMVGRILGRPVVTSLDFGDGGAPPTATIQGLDLVTEGVLTLSRAADILRTCSKSDPEAAAEGIKALDGKNGAAELARLLLEDCTHLRCFVGRAVNPAHQNPALPVDLGIKIRLIEGLCEVLRKMGKVAEITYY